MSSVAGPVEIGIVFVDGNRSAGFGSPPPRCCQHNALSGTVMRHKVPQGAALRSRVFWVAMVVVEPRPIGQHPIAALLFTAHCGAAGRVELGIVWVCGEVLHGKTTHVPSGVLAPIVPAAHPRPFTATNHGHTFGKPIARAQPLYHNAVFSLDAEQSVHN